MRFKKCLLFKICRHAKQDFDRPFGGIRLIVFGDFSQLGPILDNSKYFIEDEEYTNGYCFVAPVWSELDFKIIELLHVWRQSDAGFVDILNKLRQGLLSLADGRSLVKRILCGPSVGFEWPSGFPPHLFGKNKVSL